jgi:hypothetical protein
MFYETTKLQPDGARKRISPKGDGFLTQISPLAWQLARARLAELPREPAATFSFVCAGLRAAGVSTGNGSDFCIAQRPLNGLLDICWRHFPFAFSESIWARIFLIS